MSQIQPPIISKQPAGEIPESITADTFLSPFVATTECACVLSNSTEAEPDSLTTLPSTFIIQSVLLVSICTVWRPDEAKKEHEALQEEIDDLNKFYEEKKNIDANFEKFSKAIDKINEKLKL